MVALYIETEIKSQHGYFHRTEKVFESIWTCLRLEVLLNWEINIL